jgi:hypothetical protein
MVAELPQLDLFAPPPTDPQAVWFVRLLHKMYRWVPARDITALSSGRLDDRAIRALAEASAPYIISGQKGYKHSDHATPEEIRHFINSMESQGSKMVRRAEAVRRYAHGRIG